MYSKTRLALKYLHYLLTASNGKGHGMHSPFVFNFITDVLNDNRHFYAYDQVEQQRKKLLQDNRVLDIEDFGAGSRVMKHRQRLVTDIARSSLKPKKFAQLLFRMAAYYQPQTLLELGTSLGITTAYLAAANPQSRVITMEGSKAVAGVASQGFNHLQLHNITLVQGNFDETLQPTLQQLQQPVGLAFLDGNHRYAPTMAYFNAVLQHTSQDSIIILDDIHWSREMEQAWHEVQQHPAVQATIDLFFIGIVLLCKDFKTKQHFSIRF
jgi:predicted O-methyltransferase YrrM